MHESFFPFLRSEITEYLDEQYDTSENPNAFKRVSKRNKFGEVFYSEDGKGALIDAAAQTIMAVDFIFQGIKTVQQPSFLDEYLDLVQEAVDNFILACWDEILGTKGKPGLITNSTTSQRLPSKPSEAEGEESVQTEYAKWLLEKDPHLQAFKKIRSTRLKTDLLEETDQQEEESLEKELRKVAARLHEFQEREISFENQLIEDIGPRELPDGRERQEIQLMPVHALSTLVALCTSLNWIAECVVALGDQQMDDDNAKANWDSKLLETQAKLQDLAIRCSEVADSCILFARVEVRMIVYKCLQVVKPIRRQPHAEPEEIDPNVIMLISELSKRLVPANVFLTPDIGRILAPQSAFLIAFILRRILRSLVQINEHGASQIINSIYAYVNVISMDGFISEDEAESIFTRVHPYFDTLRSGKPHAEIRSLIEKMEIDNLDVVVPPVFDLEELEVLFNKSEDNSDTTSSWETITSEYLAKDPNYRDRKQAVEDFVQQHS